jgi:hypothetical protein
MELPNVFTKEVSEKLINRINKLSITSQPLWGKMSVSKMLAHCCIPYEYVFENKHKTPGVFVTAIMKLFVKNNVVNAKPYKENSPTGPDFLILEERDFEMEKQRLITYIRRTQDLGENYFEGKESHSFGKLSKSEWNNMFQKHLDHHLKQFGV